MTVPPYVSLHNPFPFSVDDRLTTESTTGGPQKNLSVIRKFIVITFRRARVVKIIMYKSCTDVKKRHTENVEKNLNYFVTIKLGRIIWLYEKVQVLWSLFHKRIYLI